MQSADLFCSPSRHGIYADGPTLARLLKTCRKAAGALVGPGPDPLPIPARALRDWLRRAGAEEVELILTPRRLIVVHREPGLTITARFAEDPAGHYAPTSVRLHARRRLPLAAPVAAAAGPAQQLALF